jgi:hypothetical protein
VTLLLKKRLFSSPAAFAKTLERHAAIFSSSVADDGRDPVDTGTTSRTMPRAPTPKERCSRAPPPP